MNPHIRFGALAITLLLDCLVACGAWSQEWTTVSSPNAGTYGNLLNGAAALTASDAWAVGATETGTGLKTLIERWNGTAWKIVPSPNPGYEEWGGYGNVLTGVTALSSTNAWAVGYWWNTSLDRTLALHWDGVKWSIVKTPNPSYDGYNNLYAVDAASASNVWAVGSYDLSDGSTAPLIVRWNGTSWAVSKSPVPSGSTYAQLYGVYALSATNVWAVGSYYDYYRHRTCTLIEHWDGTSWKIVPSANPGGTNVLMAITAISSNNVWAVGYYSPGNAPVLTLIEHWDGTAWRVVSSPNLSTTYDARNVLRSVAFRSASDIWAVGICESEATDNHQHRTLTVHWDGYKWSRVTSPSPGKSSELNAVAAAGWVWGVGLYSNYPINIYDGTYTVPRTLILRR